MASGLKYNQLVVITILQVELCKISVVKPSLMQFLSLFIRCAKLNPGQFNHTISHLFFLQARCVHTNSNSNTYRVEAAKLGLLPAISSLSFTQALVQINGWCGVQSNKSSLLLDNNICYVCGIFCRKQRQRLPQEAGG